MLGRRGRRAPDSGENPLEVVIAGGGVGALECALALRRLAGDRVALTLLAPGARFSYQPMAVLEPFIRRSPRHLELERFAAELAIDFVQDGVATVDAERGRLTTVAGRELPYGALVLAVGARSAVALPNAVTIDIPGTYESLQTLLDALDGGTVRAIALVAPKPTWPLPVYELALLLREHAQEAGIEELGLTIVTSEARPLAVFGDAVSSEVEAVLRDARIQTLLGAEVKPSAGELVVHPGGQSLGYDRVVALPRLQGPSIPGLPSDADGFLPVGDCGEVTGVSRVYAVGDATDFPVKFGAIAAQQADAASAAIAAGAGARVAPMPFDGVVEGFLLRGRTSPRLHFSARIEGGLAHDSCVGVRPSRTPEAKISARYLGPYLDELWASGARWLSGPWLGGDGLAGEPQR
ncbi:MAG: FAD-dependent oxidoreductase [Solirubrobacteraceae bacterium]